VAGFSPLIVDGYDDSWDPVGAAGFVPLAVRAQTRGPMLYLLFNVRDNAVVYHDPRLVNRVNGDRLILRSATGRSYTIATAAPGPVQARMEHVNGSVSWEPRIRGQWQDTLEGFSIELELPLSLLGERLGFYLLDQDGNHIAGNISPTTRRPPWLIYPPLSLQGLLDPFARSGGIRLQVVDVKHWIIGGAGSLETIDSEPSSNWLIRAIYRAILNGSALPAASVNTTVGQHHGAEVIYALTGKNSAAWYAAEQGSPQKLLSAAAPVFNQDQVVAVVVAEQNSEQYLSLTDQAFSRLLLYSLGALLISALGLLGYASWLSWRIGRLSRATANVFASDGGLRSDFPTSQSRDEIGELSRQYAQLLERLREYTDYLRSLSRKLSHELRTPIAVIQSSLDNLEQEPAQTALYLQRSREGLNRLANILTAMSEATRLEESVHGNETEVCDLAALLAGLCEGYRGVYPQHPIRLSGVEEAAPIIGVPDLLAQMLDKLVDNAVSFSPPAAEIQIQLERIEAGYYCLAIRNRGPLLPAEMQHQLFDSMVSVRHSSDREASNIPARIHLGLGLHIVGLIVGFHRGKVEANNLADGSGVEFRVSVPAHPCADG